MEFLWSLQRTQVIGVLILIIMEDTHGVEFYYGIYRKHKVLILIIMEDTHGVWTQSTTKVISRLNPYYNGRYSWSLNF